jgi:hypothetical protein
MHQLFVFAVPYIFVGYSRSGGDVRAVWVLLLVNDGIICYL